MRYTFYFCIECGSCVEAKSETCDNCNHVLQTENPSVEPERWLKLHLDDDRVDVAEDVFNQTAEKNS